MRSLQLSESPDRSVTNRTVTGAVLTVACRSRVRVRDGAW